MYRDTARHWHHPWLRIELAIRAVLADRLTRGPSARVDRVVMARVKERERIRRAGWFNVLALSVTSIVLLGLANAPVQGYRLMIPGDRMPVWTYVFLPVVDVGTVVVPRRLHGL